MNSTNVTNVTLFEDDSSSNFQNPALLRYYQKIIQSSLQFCLALMGVVTNSVNIRVFIKQGVKENTTIIGLLALSIFDFLSCIILVAPPMCLVFVFTGNEFEEKVCRAYLMLSSYPSSIFYQCSIWTTVYLSLERSLCVIMPIRVKSLLRPKVTTLTLVFIFVFFFVIQLGYSTNTAIVWRFNAEMNKSVPYISDDGFAEEYLYYYSLITSTIMSSVAWVVVAIATAVMIKKLVDYSKWRLKHVKDITVQENSFHRPKVRTSRREIELIKSVTIVTCIFLTCLSFSHIPATAMIVLPGFSMSGNNSRLFYVYYSIRMVFSLINMSINTFFYLRLSSRYRAAFAVSFPKCYRSDAK